MTIKNLAFWLVVGSGFILLTISTYQIAKADSPNSSLPFSEFPTATPTPIDPPGLKITPTGISISAPTSTNTPEPTATSEPVQYPVLLPFVFRQPAPTSTPIPVPPEKVLFCSNPNRPIPDDQPAGLSDNLQIGDSRTIVDLDIYLDISHSFIADLSASITHQEGGLGAGLFDRPGIPASTLGCGQNNIQAILDDQVSAYAENQCAASPAAISGIYIPDEPLARFNGDSIQGTWTLNLADHSLGDGGKLKNWCLVATLSGSPFVPTPTPPPVNLPSQARIYNISGQPQAFPLDCESRVAVDWANYFGVQINEVEFFSRLPKSNHPDKGFVGDVFDAWGQIPPNSYGVHAEPVAALLRKYGLNAYAHRPLSWDDLRAEIARGRPVYVWVIGSASFNEIPIFYSGSEGPLTVVAHYEHTVMVIGYTPNSVTILDGGIASTRSLSQFLSSWSALQNMAITTRP